MAQKSANYSFAAILLLGAIVAYNYWGDQILSARKERSRGVPQAHEERLPFPGEVIPAAPHGAQSQSLAKASLGRNKTDEVSPVTSVSGQSGVSSAASGEVSSGVYEDRRGREIHLPTRTISQVRDLLTQKRNLVPEHEFSNMGDVNLNDEDFGMFTGVFVDENAGLKVSILTGQSGVLLSASCIELPNKQKVRATGEQIRIREGGTGYAALLIDRSWYLRMGYSFTDKRHLIGELFRKNGEKWISVGLIDAREIKVDSAAGACHFLSL